MAFFNETVHCNFLRIRNMKGRDGFIGTSVRGKVPKARRARRQEEEARGQIRAKFSKDVKIDFLSLSATNFHDKIITFVPTYRRKALGRL